MLFSTCAEPSCRKSFLKSNRRQIYCSNACRQCAYRCRKMEAAGLKNGEQFSNEKEHNTGNNRS